MAERLLAPGATLRWPAFARRKPRTVEFAERMGDGPPCLMPAVALTPPMTDDASRPWDPGLQLREDSPASFSATRPAHHRGALTTYPASHAILGHRPAHRLWTRGWRYPARLLILCRAAVHHVDIHPGAGDWPPLFIDHGACGDWRNRRRWATT